MSQREMKLDMALQTLLEVLDEFEVSAEDGVLLSRSLLESSVEFSRAAHDEANHKAGCPAYFRQTRQSLYSPFPPDKWGLDPSLLSEEN